MRISAIAPRRPKVDVWSQPMRTPSNELLPTLLPDASDLPSRYLSARVNHQALITFLIISLKVRARGRAHFRVFAVVDGGIDVE